MLLPLLREYQQKKLLPRVRLGSYADLAAYCRTLYLGVNHEEFYVLSLDADLRLLAAKQIARGTPTEVTRCRGRCWRSCCKTTPPAR